MRTRIPIIIEESLLAKIDVIAGEKTKRSTIISQALQEFVAREESKAVNVFNTQPVKQKAASGTKSK
jgi:metal-responsive CopG/Arc/MetJ family transcriptional regulator